MTKWNLDDIKMISLKRSAPVACRYFYCHRSEVEICGIWGFSGCADEIGRGVFVTIFKIVDKSAVESSGCSGRRDVVIGRRNLVGEGERCDEVEF